MLFAASIAPNGIDIWLTGGIAIVVSFYGNIIINTAVTVTTKINIIR